MFTHEKVVETYMERAYCSACGTEMQIKPKDLNEVVVDVAIWPPPAPKYTYICPVCGTTEISEVLYPKLIYKEVNV